MKNTIIETLPYNADINLIASIPDLQMIYNAFRGDKDTAQFDLRTERTNNRLSRVIRMNLLKFHSEDHKSLLRAVYSNEKTIKIWPVLLFWQLSLTNRLVNEILTEVFFTGYYEGRAILPKNELIAFLDDKKIISSETNKEWSDNTLERIASKLLTFLKRLEVMKGIQKKHFKSIHLEDKELTIFCYLLLSVYGNSSNVLKNSFLQYSFMTPNIFMERVKKIAKKGWIDVQYDGVRLQLKPKHNFNTIVNVLYN